MAELSASQAAAALGVSRDTVYRRIKDGSLETVTSGNGRLKVLVEEATAVELMGRVAGDNNVARELAQAQREIVLLGSQIEDLRSIRDVLNDELAARREGEQQLRALLLQAQQRIPALHAPSDVASSDGAATQPSRRRWFGRG
jgi:excisionase family DNA binding protein